MPTYNKLDVQNSVDKLIKNFRTYPHKYLTEDDVRMHLCCNLMEHFGRVERTNDGHKSIALHTEIRWYGEEKYRDRSDIVIFNVNDLDVTKTKVKSIVLAGKAPSKGYAANKPIAVIELKLRRINGECESEFKKKIDKDFKKLKRLKTMMDSRNEINIDYWLIALDKTKDINYLAPENLERVKMEYVFSG